MVECLTRDRGAAGFSLTAWCPRARHINPSLVLVQPSKTYPYITERLSMGRKESNQTNKYFFKPTDCLILLDLTTNTLQKISFARSLIHRTHAEVKRKENSIIE